MVTAGKTGIWRSTGRASMLWLGLSLGLMLVLAACDTAEERAERHYESAVALLEAGEPERALVELRNVFKLQGDHRDARWLYAETQREQGELADAFGNYLRLAEFYPDDLPALRALAELAAEVREWDEAARHARAGAALEPEDPVFRAVKAAIDYREAIRARDVDAREDAVARARAILEAGADIWSAHSVVVDDLAMRGAPAAALAAVDEALTLRPRDGGMHEARLRLLVQAGDDDAVEAQLRRMVELFPENPELRGTLVAWFAERDRIADVQGYLRSLAAADPSDPWPRLTLVQILRETEGPQAARDELARLAEAAPEADLALRYRTLAATIRAQEGARAEAIAELRDLLDTAEAAGTTGAELRDGQVSLAHMLREEADIPGAKAVVNRVLEADAGHVGALRMRAAWAIEEDRTGDAITALRRALAESPRDADVLMLMAMAHLRDGSRDLAGERLALAVEVSGRGVGESMRYARFLVESGRLSAAEAVLTDALRVSRGNPALLSALTELRLQRGEPERAAQSLAQLERQAEALPELAPVAARLRALYLQESGNRGAALTFLEGLIAGGSFDISAVAQIVQTHIDADDPAAAAAYMDQLLAETPGDLSLLFLRAGVHRVMGEAERAEALYRDLVAERPDAEGPARELYGLLWQQGRQDEAEAVLLAALEVRPDSEILRWLLAGAQEARGDIDGAIDSYERLHADNSANDVFANNLAALLATHRAEPETLARAQTIARRLRVSDVPAFRDTYGWILLQRGEAADALPHLRFAAEGLPENADVQYHLALAQEALGDVASSRAALERALDLGGPADADGARALLARLDEVAGQ